MKKIIIHIDMDAFYAAVEVRDNPLLAGKPLIIGALPNERGVVSTCSYEARKFGVRSAMSIKEAFRRCPNGIYMAPNGRKYKEASKQIQNVWSAYTDIIEYVSLDEGYLDVTGSAHLFGGEVSIGKEIKQRIKREIGLTCSVGIGFSMMAAKLASEEKKPDGFFVIPDADTLKNLIIDRNARVIYGVGEKTAAILESAGIHTVRDIYENEDAVCALLGNHGKQIIELANGNDNRAVTPAAEPKSIGREITFQSDTADFNYLKDVLLLIANELSFELRIRGLFCKTVTLKITYADMKQIARSKSGDATNRAAAVYGAADAMLDKIERRSVRLAGLSLSGLTKNADLQMSLTDYGSAEHAEKLDDALLVLQRKYGRKIIKTGSELNAEKHLGEHK